MLVGAELRRSMSWAGAAALICAAALVVAPAPTPAAAAFSCNTSGPTYTVRPGDGWYAIADRAEISVRSLLEANGAALSDLIVPGDQLCLPNGANPAADCEGSYVVRAGDSWYSIAERADIGVPSLLRVNDASLERVLFVGDTLCLPGGASIPSGASSATTPAPAAPAPASGATYTVRAGDGWFAIANRVGVRAADLLRVNDASLADVIVPGQRLALPAGAQVPAAAETPTTTATTASTATYTVRSGDGWLVIADRVGVRAGDLLRVNDASLSDVIVPGQLLELPAGAQIPVEPEEPEEVWVELDALPTQGPCWFHDTWHDARDSGRRHVGTDIFTVPGEYVYAVADGRLTGRYWDGVSIRAGNAWFLTADNGDRFFYAHLQGFAPDLSVGSRVEAGQIIGWVGSTGNTTYPHLHFEIRPAGGETVNPYPMLKVQGACNTGTPYTQPGGWVPD